MKIAKILSAFALAVIVSCSSKGGNDDDGRGSDGDLTGWPFDDSREDLQQTPDLEGLRLENVIKITYNNGGEPVVNNPYEGDDINTDISGEHVTVWIPALTETEYNLVLSGTAKNGSFKIYGDSRMGLYLNGVNITNSNGPAINIQNNKRVIVHLVKSAQNYLADGTRYATPPGQEDAKGTFFSEGTLSFEGSGSLEVRAKANHAIVTDGHFEMENGKIIVSESANDGIHANQRIEVKGGVVKITCVGDALQNERDFPIKISGGKVALKTSGVKSHGIASFGYTSINDSTSIPTVQISVSGNGSKGINSSKYLEFKGGTTAIQVSGTRHINSNVNPADTSNASGIKVDYDLFIEGGELTIKSTGDKAKGISVDGDITMDGGKIDIEADDDGIKVDGDLKVTGGSGKVTSKKKKAINCKGICNKGSLNTIDAGL